MDTTLPSLTQVYLDTLHAQKSAYAPGTLNNIRSHLHHILFFVLSRDAIVGCFQLIISVIIWFSYSAQLLIPYAQESPVFNPPSLRTPTIEHRFTPKFLHSPYSSWIKRLKRAYPCFKASNHSSDPFTFRFHD